MTVNCELAMDMSSSFLPHLYITYTAGRSWTLRLTVGCFLPFPPETQHYIPSIRVRSSSLMDLFFLLALLRLSLVVLVGGRQLDFCQGVALHAPTSLWPRTDG